MATNNKLKVYFIHSDKIDYNNIIYLPVLRSELLSNHEMIFSHSEKNREIYYKDLMDKAELYVVELTEPNMGFNMELKHALLSKKPILALASKRIGYDEKYQKLIKNVIGYNNEDEFRYFVETFVKNYEDKIIAGRVDPTLVLGELK